jgi:hypothetical protein
MKTGAGAEKNSFGSTTLEKMNVFEIECCDSSGNFQQKE